MNRFTAILSTIVVLVAIVGGAITWWLFQGGYVYRIYTPHTSTTLPGGAKVDDFRLSQADVAVRRLLWSRARDLPEAGKEPSAEAISGPWVPGTHLVVSMVSEEGDRDLYLRVRHGGIWSPPKRFDGENGPNVNTKSDEVDPAISPDGRTLYYSTNRAGGSGGYDLWVTKLREDRWTKPRALSPRINSPYDDRGPTVHPSGKILAFASNRPRSFLIAPPSWSTIDIASRPAAKFQLAFVSQAAGGAWTRPHLIDSSSSLYHDTDPEFSPLGDYLYFASDRPGGAGSRDLYRAKVLRDTPAEADGPPVLTCGKGQNLEAPTNTPANEMSPYLLDAGFSLLYESAAGKGGDERLVASHSIEVQEQYEIAELPAAAIFANLGRIIVLFISSVALAVVLVVLYRTRHEWTQSLLARCAVVAILAHAGLLWGFYFWKVRTELIAMAKQEREENVEHALESSLAASISVEVNSQDLTIPMDAPDAEQTPSSSREDMSLEPTRTPERLAATADPHALNPGRVEIAMARKADPNSVRQQQADLSARAQRIKRVSDSQLPQAQRSPEANEAEASPSAQPEASLRINEEIRRTTTVDSAKIDAPILPDRGDSTTAADLARAPVVSEERNQLLPSESRPSIKSPTVNELPTPQQSPKAEEATSTPDPRSSARDSAAAKSALAATDSDAQPFRVDQPQRNWDSTPTGIQPSLDDARASVKIPQALEVPRRTAAPVPGARHKLPNDVPLADRSAATGSATPEMTPQTSGRQTTSEARETSPLRSNVARQAVGPISVARQSAATARPSAFARPSPDTTPGALTPIEAGVPEPSKLTKRKILPESGGRVAADIVSPLAPSKSSGRHATAAQATALTKTERPKGATPSAEQPAPRASEKARTAAPKPLVAKPLERPTSGGRLVTKRVTPSVRLTPAATRPKSSARIDLPEAKSGELLQADVRVLRRPANRERIAMRSGGTKESEAAVVLALEWLARHQSPDGRWDSDDPKVQSHGFDPDIDAAVTGLTILCFLGHYHLPDAGKKLEDGRISTGTGRFSPNVTRALKWLLTQQDKRGVIAGDDERNTMYSHGINTLAVSESYLMTRDEALLGPLKKAVQVILDSQNTKTGGWRYKPKPPIRGDTSITGWQVLALTSAKSAGVKIPDTAFDRARHWFDKEVASGVHGGIYGYRNQDEPRVAMAAEGMYARILLGAKRDFPAVEEAARYVDAGTRAGEELGNLYLLYYGTLALHQYQGWIWDRWNKQVRDFLLVKQRRDGALKGSWDPMDEYLETGGRVLSTAFATLTLEVYYRYLPLYWNGR